MAYKKSFEPLKITAHLRTGVVSDQWLPLDGILLYQASRHRLGVQAATRPGGEDHRRGVTMPLMQINYGSPNWYFACSWAYPQPWWLAEGQDHWNKRFDNQFADLVDFGGKRGKIVVEAGEYKAYHMPVYYRVAERVEWYAVGDRAEIEALLSTMTHIGKKVAYGFGRVIRWSVESASDDWSIWRDGRLMRGIPAGDAAGKGIFNLANYGYRPAYYRRVNQALLAMPEVAP